MSNVIRLSISRLCGGEPGRGMWQSARQTLENREAGCDCPDGLQHSLTWFRCHVPPFRASIVAHLAGYSRNYSRNFIASTWSAPINGRSAHKKSTSQASSSREWRRKTRLENARILEGEFSRRRREEGQRENHELWKANNEHNIGAPSEFNAACESLLQIAINRQHRKSREDPNFVEIDERARALQILL